jgi:hypothetical protein
MAGLKAVDCTSDFRKIARSKASLLKVLDTNASPNPTAIMVSSLSVLILPRSVYSESLIGSHGSFVDIVVSVAEFIKMLRSLLLRDLQKLRAPSLGVLIAIASSSGRERSHGRAAIRRGV